MSFKTIDAFLAQTGKDAPTSAERALISHCQAGTHCILSETRPTSGTNANTIRATLLRLLIFGGTPDCGLDARGVWVEGAWITGKLTLADANIGGSLKLRRCHFAQMIDLSHTGTKAVSFFGSQLSGLSAPNLTMAGSLEIKEVVSLHFIDLRGAKIDGRLDAEGCELHGAARTISAASNPEKVALDLEGSIIRNSVFLRSARIDGLLNLNGACLGGILDLRQSWLNGYNGRAVTAYRATIKAGLRFQTSSEVKGCIDLTSAYVGDLDDDAASWPKTTDDLILDGFSYDRLSGNAPVTLAARRNWLAIGSSVKGDFRPQPYTQFARTLRAMGHAGEARKVLLERDCRLGVHERKLQRQKPDGTARMSFENPFLDLRLLLRYFADLALRWFAGYGHRPLRSILWLIGLFLAATTLAHLAWQEGSFAPNSDVILTTPEWTDIAAQGCVVADAAGCVTNPAAVWSAKNAPGMDWDSFNALAYAADLVVPLIDLGQTRAWAPSKDRGPLGLLMWGGRWVFIIAGWVVASLGLAAVTGFVHKNAPE